MSIEQNNIAKPASHAVSAGEQQFQASGVLTVSSAHFIHDTYSSFLAPLLPVLIENLTLTKTAAGLLAVFYQWPSLLQPFIGHLGDRFNLRLLVVLGPAVTAAMMSLLGVAPTYAVLALLLITAGLSSAGLHAIGPVIAGLLSGRQLGRGMSYWMVGGELSRTIGPVILVAGVTLLTPRGLPWLMIGGLTASLVIALRLRSIPDYRPPAGSGMPWREALARMRPFLFPLAAVIGTRAFLFAALTTFLPTFLTEEGAGLWFAGTSLSIMEAAGVVGALSAGVISDRIGRRHILTGMTLVTPLLVLLFLNTHGWLLYPLLLLIGLTLLSTTPVLMALVLEQARDFRALANGVYMALNFVLISVGTLGIGILGDSFDLRTALYISIAIMLIGLPFTLMLPKDVTKSA